tara:strand:+ start:505 stop:651 length:147 start_codon:yes stop_codon:yes gene_type:complete
MEKRNPIQNEILTLSKENKKLLGELAYYKNRCNLLIKIIKKFKAKTKK